MGRFSLTVLAVIFFVCALVAWWYAPTRTVDWVPLVAVSIALGAVDVKLKGLQKQLDSLRPPR